MKNPCAERRQRRKRAKAPVKRRFKVRVIIQPMLANPTPPAVPNPTVVNTVATTQIPVSISAAMADTSLPVTVYNLAQSKF